MRRFLRLSSISLILFFFVGNDIYGQKRSRKLIKADEAFVLEKYDEAVELYKKVYEKIDGESDDDKALKAQITFMQAECYLFSGDIDQAETYYKRAIESNFNGINDPIKYDASIKYLKYADVLRMRGAYKTAKRYYTKFLVANGMNKSTVEDLVEKDRKIEDYVPGEMGLRSCNFALKWKNMPTRYKVKSMPLLNTEYIEYGVSFGDEDYLSLYFTSSRAGGVSEKTDPWTGEFFSDIYQTKMDKKGRWSIPEILPEPINTEGNEGSVFLNSSGTRMYLTRCKAEKKKINNCHIYVSKKSKSGRSWLEPELLQIDIDSNISIGHPTLNEEETMLIFSSEMSTNKEEGYGGKDLWVVNKEKRNNWSKPKNLGSSVNTNGDEMFPFLHKDGTLYFASTGHVGMGGLDIYKTSQDEFNNWIDPINLKFPINSPANDFGIIVEDDGEQGYLISSRKRGNKGKDDIYQFTLPGLEFSVTGILTDSKSGAILTGAPIQLLSNEGGVRQTFTDNTGTYQFDLEPLTTYKIVVDIEGYLSKTVSETTLGIENDSIFEINIPIDPIKKEIILPRIEYDFAKWDLRPQSIIDLDILTETLKENPEVMIELKSHTDFVGTYTQNMVLSQQRADVCIAYLISQGIEPGRLIAKGMGETEPFVIEAKDGRFDVGDVLTERYIKRIFSKKNKEKAHQYNRRTSFKVLEQDYEPVDSNGANK
tara:strand:+ start:3776 stop:5896 length:2121 start_codon:yes stop_codon:yes gene_type:complete